MIDDRIFEELRQRIDEALRNSPAQDIEKNLRALLSAWFDRLDLVLDLIARDHAPAGRVGLCSHQA